MTQQRRLGYLLAINVAMIAATVVAGWLAHSLGLLAAGGDYIADSSAIALGLLAVYWRDHHGRVRAPVYVALVNVLLLLGITVAVSAEAVNRLLHRSPEIHGLPVLIVAAVSALAMALGAFILGRGAAQEDLHMRSVLLDTVADGLSAAGVAVVGGIIYVSHGLYWLDAAAALAVSAVIVFSALHLLGDVIRALKRGAVLEISDD